MKTRVILLFISLISAFVNVVYPHNALYIISAAALFLWFYSRINEPSADGEKMIAMVSIIGTISAFLFTMERHSGAGELAFLVVVTLISAGLIFSRHH